MGRTLMKVDKNGTKYWHNVCTCPRCGGTGIVNIYIPINGGECFECNGCGRIEYIDKEYTEEYLEKLEARRKKAEEKRLEKHKAEADKLNKSLFERNGYNEEGFTFVALGNTYEVRETLRQKGFKFDKVLGWHSPIEVDGVVTFKINVADVLCSDFAGAYIWNSNVQMFFVKGEEVEYVDGIEYADGFSWEYKAKVMIDKANKEYAESLPSEVSPSEYVGNEGDKIEIELTIDRVVEVSYKISDWRSTSNNIYIMHDNGGNVFTWKTANCVRVPRDKDYDGYKYINDERTGYEGYATKGDVITLKGTVKEHTVYNGVKQTVLTRCKAV